jgi:hypothetical protein
MFPICPVRHNGMAERHSPLTKIVSFFNNIEIYAIVVYFLSIFNKLTQFDFSNKVRPLLIDFKGCTVAGKKS